MGSLQLELLAALVPYLQREMLDKALKESLIAILTTEYYNSVSIVRACTTIAAHLGELERVEVIKRALNIALSVEERERIDALTTIAPFLNDNQLQEALDAIYALDEPHHQIPGLAMLAPYVQGKTREKILHSALDFVRQNGENKPWQAKILTMLAPSLTSELMVIAVEIAMSINDKYTRREALQVLATYMNKDILQRKLAQAHLMESRIDSLPAFVIANLAPQLIIEDNSLQWLTHLSRWLPFRLKQIHARDLVMFKPTSSGQQLFLLLAAMRFCLIYARPIHLLLVELINLVQVPFLQTKLQLRLADIEKEDYEQRRVQMLWEITPHLYGNLLKSGLEIALKIQDEGYRARALGNFAPFLPRKLQETSLRATQKFEDEWRKIYVLAAHTQFRRLDATYVMQIQEGIVNILYNHYQDSERREVVKFCSSELGFLPSILSKRILARIAHDIDETDTKWTWL